MRELFPLIFVCSLRLINGKSIKGRLYYFERYWENRKEIYKEVLQASSQKDRVLEKRPMRIKNRSLKSKDCTMNIRKITKYR